MATAAKKKRKPGEPSPAQLRARRKFAQMAKQRSKEAKAKKRAAAQVARGKKRPAATKTKKNGFWRDRVADKLRGKKVKPLRQVVRDKLADKIQGKKKNTAKPRRNAETRDASHPIHVRQYWQGRKGYKTPWQRAHAAGQKQLFAMNPAAVKQWEKAWGNYVKALEAYENSLGKGKHAHKAPRMRLAKAQKAVEKLSPGYLQKISKKPNPTTLSKAKKLREEFLGAPTKKVTTMYAPKGSGARGALGLMGKLKGVKIKGRGKLKFDGTGAILARSGKNKMYVLGKSYKLDHLKGARRNPDGFIDLGEITTIEYEATKHQLGDTAPITYYHHMGEEGGTKPHAIVNDEGLLLIEGGEYDINERGIIN